MGGMAVVLNRSGQRPGVDLVVKFLEHFAGITEALDELGLWDEADGLYYDRLKTPSGETVPVKVRSMVGIIPALAAVVIGENDLRQSLTVGKRGGPADLDPHQRRRRRRPCFGGTELMQTNPEWHDNLIFSEYFHGDNGAAIGAFHQTGWTGVIADLIRRRHGDVEAVGDVVRRMGMEMRQ